MYTQECQNAHNPTISWDLSDELSRVVDRVIKIPQFLQGLVQVRAACVVTGVEQGKRDAKELVTAREFNPEVEVDEVTKIQEMEDVMASLTETDFACYLCLGSLDMVGIRDLCQDAQSDGSRPGPSSSPGDGNTPAPNYCYFLGLL